MPCAASIKIKPDSRDGTAAMLGRSGLHGGGRVVVRSFAAGGEGAPTAGHGGKT